MDENFCKKENNSLHDSRRNFLKQSSALAALTFATPVLVKAAEKELDEKAAAYFEKLPVKLEVNGTPYQLSVEPRVTLLDLLREQLHLTGTKKGCDYGQCGACTVHADGKRVLSCLSLAVMQDGKKITTIEGLSKDGDHPVQKAWDEADVPQCGYCQSGQMMTAVALLKTNPKPTVQQINDAMHGNICRCGSYHRIREAIQLASKKI